MPRTPDPDAALFEQLRPRLTAISRRIVGSAPDAEDIVQDCFLKWHGADRHALQTPAAWLTTVVQHQSIDRLRMRAREDVAARGALDLAPETSPALPEDALLRGAELGEAMARMLTRLSPAERLALVLREVFDCEHADIAAALGTTTINARQHLARARRRLREEKAAEELDEKRCRELVLRFQAAINGFDLPAMLSLLTDAQPVSVLQPPGPRLQMHGKACANDASYQRVIAA